MALTDGRLAQLARESEKLAEEIAALKVRKKKRDDKIIAELNRRSTRSIDTHGLKITAVSAQQTTYDFEGLVEDLGAAKARKFQKREVDKKKLSEFVQSGRIDGALVARHTSTSWNAPYISVSPGG